jgi:H+/gluconate symporter-like permease
LIHGTIALGAFTMTALPGTPAIQNAIPMSLFGTTLFAAPRLGLIAVGIMLFLGGYLLQKRAPVAMNAGERYEAQTIEVRGAGHEVAATSSSMTGNFPDTSVFAGLPPVFIVLIGNYVTVTLVIPRVPIYYLATIPYGATTIASVAGI